VPIRTEIWRSGENAARWRVVNAETGEVVIDKGVIETGEAPVTAKKPGKAIRFDEQVAVITGAGGGLGRAYARALAARGARVVVNDPGWSLTGEGQNASVAEATAEEIRRAGGTAVADTHSVTDPEGGESIVQTALTQFGRIDILIHNAGILRDKSFLKMTPEEWRAVMDVHLNGAYNTVKPAFSAMRDQGFGRIVLTTSAAGLFGLFGQANYAAAKMGLVGLAHTLALEGRKYDIFTNAVAPVAKTRMTEGLIPAGPAALPEQVVPMVLYLSSRECAASGKIFHAGLGTYARIRLAAGFPVTLEPAPEAIRDHFTVLMEDTGGAEYPDAAAAIAGLSDTGGEKAAFQEKEITPAEIFADMAKGVDPAAISDLEAVFVYRISGEAGGEWTVTVEKGTCRVEAGGVEQPDCVFFLSDHDFVKVAAGRLDPVEAFSKGILKVEGDIGKALKAAALFPKRGDASF
jgi:NAD(P)-dependent dehydrogenase (short-subunit alcohol dehydrogenase family)/putative sterol carrier protein